MRLKTNALPVFIFVSLIALQLAVLSGCRNDRKQAGHRLSQSGSAYLRQHADNPVEWYQWGQEALGKAKRENKPLLISIGYASCHWCHVMEEESFMDTSVARMMNKHFVPVKIDREQRPDIDQIYIHAAQLISGSAGWPLNAFALPDGKPFYAGTYFPKNEWLALLRQISDAYHEDRTNVQRQAEALTRGIAANDLFANAADSAITLTRQKYVHSLRQWNAQLDFVNGGQRGTIKFPMPVVWECLLQFNFLTGDKNALEIVETTLTRMARGGIYDQVGGGFSRYAVDSLWQIPHFEKMLYDNAQLVSVYSHAYQVTRNPVYKGVVMETLNFIEREMTDPSGAFYSSVNADSEGEEGKYYTWTRGEINQVLGQPFGDVFCEYYNVSHSGNREDGTNILYSDMPEVEFASRQNMGQDEWVTALRQSKKKLYEARRKRVPPATDQKIITSWNALMTMALLDAYSATSREEYFSAALANARFLKETMMRDDGKLARIYADGKPEIDAFLDDYANLAMAFIKLYQQTFDVTWLHQARLLADYAIEHFSDADGAFFFYASDESKGLVVRKKELADEVIPSSNSVLTEVFLLLGEFYYDDKYKSRAEKMLDGMAPVTLGSSGIFYANWARVAGFATWTPFMTAIVGNQALDKSRDFRKAYHPLVLLSGGEVEDLPALENKLISGKTTIYVCRNRVCDRPVEKPSQALRQLSLPMP